jgi:DeoR/GlpR family transcriptional regulator of sugar metabolism
VSGAPLPAGRRRDLIHDVLDVRGFATVRELAVLAGVSKMTVRRDLDALAVDGTVRRVHGGAEVRSRTLRPSREPEPAYADRIRMHEGAKLRLARHAARLVRDGDTVALDGSTTVSYLAQELRDRPVTLLTNNLLVPDVAVGGLATVHLVGGTVRPETRTMVGAATLAALGGLHADLAFLSCTGLDGEIGMTDGDPDEIAVKRALMNAAVRSIALVDASKFGRRSLQTLAAPSEVERIILDLAPDPPLAAALQRAGVVVEVAHDGPDASSAVALPSRGAP